VDAGTAVLHFTRDADDRAFPIRDRGSVEQLHQLWHKPFAEHGTGLEQRAQIFDELTGEWVADHGHAHCPRSWPISLDAEFRENCFAAGDDLADLDHDFLPSDQNRSWPP